MPTATCQVHITQEGPGRILYAFPQSVRIPAVSKFNPHPPAFPSMHPRIHAIQLKEHHASTPRHPSYTLSVQAATPNIGVSGAQATDEFG